MRVEVPEFKRCCCCIPLRYGLLIWAYLRMVANLLNIFIFVVLAMKLYEYMIVFFTIVVVLCFIWVLIDIGFTITFIVGAHKKNYKLLRMFYYFLIACIALYTLIYLLIIGNEIHSFQQMKMYYTEDDPVYSSFLKRFWWHIIEYVANYILTIVATSYLVLLVRSENLKLMRNCKFEFVNNAAAEEAQCQLSLESEVPA